MFSKVFDSSLNIWFASEDLPEDDWELGNKMLNWNDDLLWINLEKIWKFEIDTWNLFSEIDMIPDGWQFAFSVPNDFAPECSNEK